MKNNLVIVISILISFGILSCNSHSKVLSINDFTALYVDSLKRAYPDDRFLQVDDSTVYEISKGDTGISAMENVYHHYRSCPDSLGVVLHNRLLTKRETQQQTTSKSVFMPIIKYKNYMKAMIAKLNEGRPTPDSGVYEEYNDDLVIAYVVNTNYAMKYLNRSDLDSLKLSFDSLRTIAFTNLRRLLPTVKIHGSKVFMPVVEGFDNGTFEATLLLLPDFIRDKIPVKGDAVIAVPTRDILLVTGSEDKESIALLQAKLPRLFKNDYPISDHLYKWNGKKFVRFDP